MLPSQASQTTELGSGWMAAGTADVGGNLLVKDVVSQ